MSMDQGKGELTEAVLMTDGMPAEKMARLAHLEQVIKTDLKAFLRVGAALAEIRDNELYTTLTFDEYLKTTWGMGRSQGYRLIDAHCVVEDLRMSPIGDMVVEPETESQVRPLTKYKDRPDIAAKAWHLAVMNSPTRRPTAGMVRASVIAVSGEEAVKKIRAATVKKDPSTPGVSDAFELAYRALMEVIGKEIIAGFATSDKAEIINHLEAALEAVNQA